MFSIELHAFWAILGIVALVWLPFLRFTYKNEVIDKTVLYWIIITLLVVNFVHLWLSDETARFIIGIQ